MKNFRKTLITAAAVVLVSVLGLVSLGCPAAEEPPPLYPLDLPKTGQTTSYEAGDDGYLQKGVEWPSPRFVDNGDGTVTDLLTGLMWTQDGNATNYIPWTDALTYCNTLDHAGHQDWRLPNIKELMSLVNFGEADNSVWLNSAGFVGVQDSEYWSSTTDGDNTSSAKTVNMDSSEIGEGIGKGGSSGRVLAVRSETDGTISLPKTGQTTSYATGDDGDLQMGVDWPAERFVDNGDNTVTDTLTGLMWQKEATSIKYSFSDALNYCQSLPGYTDWRLPNILEGESLINYEEGNQEAWLAAQGFSGFSNPVDQFWSSTTAAYNTSYIWVIYVYGGGLSSKGNNLDQYVFAVRSAD